MREPSHQAILDLATRFSKHPDLFHQAMDPRNLKASTILGEFCRREGMGAPYYHLADAAFHARTLELTGLSDGVSLNCAIDNTNIGAGTGPTITHALEENTARAARNTLLIYLGQTPPGFPSPAHTASKEICVWAGNAFYVDRNLHATVHRLRYGNDAMTNPFFPQPM